MFSWWSKKMDPFGCLLIERIMTHLDTYQWIEVHIFWPFWIPNNFKIHMNAYSTWESRHIWSVHKDLGLPNLATIAKFVEIIKIGGCTQLMMLYSKTKCARSPRRFLGYFYTDNGCWAKFRNHQLTSQFTRACLVHQKHEFTEISCILQFWCNFQTYCIFRLNNIYILLQNLKMKHNERSATCDL